MHLALAQKYLADAADRSSSQEVAQARTECEKAAEKYSDYASRIVPKDKHSDQIIRSAGGLMECGRPLETLALILDHAEVARNPTILHLKSDALLALGEPQAAALAYQQWIDEKCAGYYGVSYSKPIEKGEPLIRLSPADGPKDPCAYLAPELRSRLEMLRKRFEHPYILPRKNYPVFPDF